MIPIVKSHGGSKRMWPFSEMSYSSAIWWSDIANLVLLASLVFGVIATFAIVQTGNVKEAHWEEDRRLSAERTAKLISDAEQSKAKAAEAELKLEQLRRQVSPRTITQAQQNEISAKLSTFKGQRATIEAAPSTPETEMLARWLGPPLAAAGWEVRTLPGRPTATILFPTGIIVAYPLPSVGPIFLPKDEHPAAAALVKALTETGLVATALPMLDGPADTITITVSTK